MLPIKISSEKWKAWNMWNTFEKRGTLCLFVEHFSLKSKKNWKKCFSMHNCLEINKSSWLRSIWCFLLILSVSKPKLLIFKRSSQYSKFCLKFDRKINYYNIFDWLKGRGRRPRKQINNRPCSPASSFRPFLLPLCYSPCLLPLATGSLWLLAPGLPFLLFSWYFLHISTNLFFWFD
jgi:hypothetical protein